MVQKAELAKCFHTIFFLTNEFTFLRTVSMTNLDKKFVILISF